MNLLGIVQEFCKRTGLQNPAYVSSSADLQSIQIQALLNEVCADLTSRWRWQEVVIESTFTSVAAESQGLLTTLAPISFLSLVESSVFDRTQGLNVEGPIGSIEWQALKASGFSGALYRFRIQQGKLLFRPAPVAGHTIAFEYLSSAPIYNGIDAAYKQYFTKDTDDFLLDGELVLAGLRWKWKAEKGLPYGEEFSAYESRGNILAGRSGGKRKLNMGGGTLSAVPGIFIAPGSYPL